MELKIFSMDKETGKIELPIQFNEYVRIDIIRKAVISMQSNRRQKYGADPRAGKKCSAEMSRRRRKYRGSYGMGISRIPRKVMSSRGTQLNYVGAFAPGTVGGRKAHAPKAEKIWNKKINKKERRKAIRSALSATLDKELVMARGHKVPNHYPFVLDNDVEKINKTKDLKKYLTTAGLTEDLKRAEVKKVRAGKGKMRGRKYRRKKSVLLVVGTKCELSTNSNLPGVEIKTVESINTELLAPGAVAGRMTLFTKNAIERLSKENMFM